MFTLLKTFITVVEQENFRKASEILYISQPSVTVHIKQLEKELGFTLFERTNKNVALTEEGREFLKIARSILDTYFDGLEKLNSTKQGYRSKFSIAISPLIADTILPFVLRKYMEKLAQTEISVTILESKDIEEAVLKEEVDIGLSCLPSFQPKLTVKKIYDDEVILVAPHDGRDLEAAPQIEMEELFSQYHLLTHNHPGYWEDLLKVLKAKHPQIKTMKVSQVHITKRFIEEGLGISFIPRSTVRRELLEGRLLEIYDHSIEIPNASTYAIVKHYHSLEHEFLEFLGQYRYV